MQDLYNKNKKSIAERILSGRLLEESSTTPEINKVEEIYRGILESSPNIEVPAPYTPKTPSGPTLHPITVEEIEKAKEGWSNLAPGSDNITVAAIKSTDNHHLAIIYNAILLTSITPSAITIGCAG